MILAGALLAIVATGCAEDDPAVAGRLAVDGRAEVGVAGEAFEAVVGERALRYGEQVRVVEGTAVVSLAGERELELREGSVVELSELADGDGRRARPLVLEGDALAVAPDDSTLAFVVGGAEGTVTGAARISLSPPLAVSYAGRLLVRTGPTGVTVPALRRVGIPDRGGTVGPPAPAEYDAANPWDRRFLGGAIELGNELQARSQGFSAQQAAGEGRSAAFFRGLFPALEGEPELGSLVNPGREPGETLIGAAIVLESTREGDLAERWGRVFGFRDEGAQWGLVAKDEGVTRIPLLGAVDAAIARSFAPEPSPGAGGPGGVASGGGPDGGGTSGSGQNGGGTGGGGTGGGGTGGGGTGGGGAGPGSPTPPVATTVPPGAPASPGGGQSPPGGQGPLNTGVPLLDDTVNSLVEVLVGLLRSLGGT